MEKVTKLEKEYYSWEKAKDSCSLRNDNFDIKICEREMYRLEKEIKETKLLTNNKNI